MSKILDATCNAEGEVTADGYPVPEAEVLSAGTAESSGLLFIDGEKARYMPSSSSDIGATIDKVIESLDTLSDVLTKIALTFTSIGSGMTGPTTAPPPTLGTDVTEINNKVVELEQIKSELETLKGELK